MRTILQMHQHPFSLQQQSYKAQKKGKGELFDVYFTYMNSKKQPLDRKNTSL